MNIFEGGPIKKPKIETVESAFGSVSYSPERGGIITSLKFKGIEVLYMDEKTFEDKSVNVKGGIPILFPNAGPIPDELKGESLGGLAQHGFARDSSKWTSEKISNGFVEELVADAETKKVFPDDFKLSISGTFENDGSFTIMQSVQNTGTEEMPLSMGLHPYFAVPSSEKPNIKFIFPGSELVTDNIGTWANGKAVTMDNPQFLDESTKIKFIVPSIGTFTLDMPKEYHKLWVWSLTDKDFICVEPIMRSEGGIIKDPEKIPPGETFSLKFNINLDVLR